MGVICQILLASALNPPWTGLRAWEAVSDARLAIRIKAIRDAGDPVTMAELAKTYPDPPAGKNAASLYNRAFQLLGQWDQDEKRKRLPSVGEAKHPQSGETLPPALLGELRAYLTSQADSLRLLHEAAAVEPCRFRLEFAKGFEMELPHLVGVYHATRLLAAEAMERSQSGKPEEAMESLLAGLRCAHGLDGEPITIATLVRIADDAILVRHLKLVVNHSVPSPQAMQRLEAALRAEADPTVIGRAFVGERCIMLNTFQTVFLKDGHTEDDQLRKEKLVYRMLPTAFLKADMACYLDLMGEPIASARKPYPQSLQEGARRGSTLVDRMPRYYPLCGTFLPAIDRIFTEGQSHMARMDTARLALAALRYRAQHHRLPEKLDDLVPDFVQAIPPDPFTGRALRYRSDAPGFVIYSVGEDLIDDGGRTEDEGPGSPPDTGFRIR